jgi:hypothetical protein
MLSFKLIQSAQPHISSFKKFLMIFDFIQQKFTKISFISPHKLMTHNRKDIEYRVQFLKDVIDNSILPEKTLYYQFIADDDKNILMDAEKVSNDFLKLYESIKKNKIKEPIAIGNYLTKKIKTRYLLKGKKFWINVSNDNNFQVINGAHRLAVAIFLELDEIPVKIYKSFSFEIPNYTEYLKIKEKKYLENLKIND